MLDKIIYVTGTSLGFVLFYFVLAYVFIYLPFRFIRGLIRDSNARREAASQER